MTKEAKRNHSPIGSSPHQEPCLEEPSIHYAIALAYFKVFEL
jgi:hypothetical protein